MAKIHVCDYCETKLGELACSNRFGGSYCSVRCADIAEMEEQSKESPQSTEDIIANLARRVAELERMNKEYVEVLSRRIDSAKDDIETWAQEHEKTKRELDDKIEMCIDDIATLDKRTEHVNTRRCCGCQNR